jgi:hypothetical protein
MTFPSRWLDTVVVNIADPARIRFVFTDRWAQEWTRRLYRLGEPSVLARSTCSM